MKIQLEQLDLAQPWRELALKSGYYAMTILVRIGDVPVGDVMVRPARRRIVSHRGLRKRIAERLSVHILRVLTKDALCAGPEAMQAFGTKDDFPRMAGAPPERIQQFVHDKLLAPEGLPKPYAQLASQAQTQPPAFDCPAVTVVVCTRDRAQQLEGCIECLKQLDYPSYEILICDNSENPEPTQQVCERLGAGYAREPIAGLSRARNTALASARTRWLAFTDDDCRPHKNWLKELVRPLQDSGCGCVCGLVLPAQLDNAAEITFEIYGGLGRGYTPVVFDRGWLAASHTKPPKTWRIGAGASMLLDRELVLKLGGFDIDLGPGGVGGCGEDTLVFYQILRSHRTIHYAPRAFVGHHHRASDEALKKHIRSYAIGHAAYHWYLLWRYGDYRSLIQLCWHLPVWFARNFYRGYRGLTKYPMSLVPIEARGTLLGPIQLTTVKLRNWIFGRPRPVRKLTRAEVEAITTAKNPQPHADVSDQKRARVA